MQKIVIGWIYRHFKGMEVRVIGIALHSETMEEMVVYSHSDPVKGKIANTLWVRPKTMFLETIEKGGERISRFELINK